MIKPYLSPHLNDPSLWKVVKETVPSLGKKRDAYVKKLDKELGPGTWRFAWRAGEDKTIGFEEVCTNHYEKSYHDHLNIRRDQAEYLSQKAADVYDNDIEDVESMDDYLAQNGDSTHIQDIAIRRAMAKLNIPFNGDDFIQVRSSSPDPIGRELSPHKVKFHDPSIVNRHQRVEPSVEDFWQRNRVIEFCDKLAKIAPFDRADYIYGDKKLN